MTSGASVGKTPTAKKAIPSVWFMNRLAATAGRGAKILVPLALVLAVFVAAAAIKGWSFLPFMQASGPKIDPADWCRGHGVPESLCLLCNPELKETLQWCGGHGLPEALCTLCHPELAERFVMCVEHNLPESHCTVCNPPAADAKGASETCAAHGVPASECRSCPPRLSADSEAAELCKLELPCVELASARTGRDAGIEAVAVQDRSMVQTIERTGRVTYNENQLAHVRPRVDGILHEVRVEAGAKVRRGDVLAVLDSVQLSEAKAAYLSATATFELAEKSYARLERLAEQQAVAGKSLLEGETRLSEARIAVTETRQRLFNFGIQQAQVERFVETQDTGSLLPITAPLDGVVVRRHAVRGEAVEMPAELFAVADLSNLWVHLDLFEGDLRWVRVGQPVAFTVESLPQNVAGGKLTWINPEVDARTRTIEARAQVDNARGHLRSGMFGTGTIEIDAPERASVVLKSAVQWHEQSPVVFVKKSDTLFEPRRVTIGRRDGPFWEITNGIAPEELVVTTGSFLLKTELMKGSIGAGCCGD